MNDEIKKKVDESWNENAYKDVKKPEGEASERPAESSDSEAQEFPPANFISFVTSLGMQAFMQMGLMPEARTGKSAKDLKHAKFLIDTLTVLETKTKGNLDESEHNALEQLLYELRLKFVEATQAK